MAVEDVSARCNAIEECYEFLLAYAGQGLSGREGSQSSSQVREYLNQAVRTLTGLAQAYAEAVQRGNLQPAERYLAYLKVLEQDAADALASIQLVLAQATISSQLIDNLNASIHLRALLTDLFLIDEILKPQQAAAPPS
jgi:thioredoxin-like negative regulator of GroEL